MSRSTSAATPAHSNQLDPQQIALLRGMRGGTLLPELLRTYRGQATKQITELEMAANNADADAVRLIAHTLKSASFSVGATGIGELCAQLEQNARTNRLDANAALYGELVERFASLVAEIEHYETS
jgi:two-component system, sensor histidine kinase and response regulator